MSDGQRGEQQKRLSKDWQGKTGKNEKESDEKGWSRMLKDIDGMPMTVTRRGRLGISGL